ncbi:ribokinase [Pediococcus claussenii]|uniref:Ribokinase n=1 Tax=Pediococcus claussenii (strain ATCC BAA-344 / DSM 14800 / JCM 18046 / KCTC 3811 / LMG 21948 / P06) TaxID=701521 RepID=G8PCQ1_PEDCP|nr:ribokinase [Pediococcus claussenii]AEV95036.1 ribokinase [Pediococcus claussenii ATCC BAA-344]ANZ70225.1 ribokinase [Pediococcus claussenii]ANZ72041.1 ribokinase [Pediococcus claussenii]KRN19162.1 rbsK protein [Pediococcus claussenii]
MTNRIVVIGSLNVDTILQASHFPSAGETLALHDEKIAGGGKGANQAISASRSGAKTSFIGKVGDDSNGKYMLEQLSRSGIDLSYISISKDTKTGQAFVILEDSGENRILIYAGANGTLNESDAKMARDKIREADFVIAQLETPIAATIEAFKIARDFGVKTILNPAPAIKELPNELLELTDIITPNETEAEILTGIKIIDKRSEELASAILHNIGIETVLITLGSEGVYYSSKKGSGNVAAIKVNAVDTTAAGDTFLGALAAELKPNLKNLEEAIKYGNKASSIAVQKIGAQPSIPSRKEIRK